MGRRPEARGGHSSWHSRGQCQCGQALGSQHSLHQLKLPRSEGSAGGRARRGLRFWKKTPWRCLWMGKQERGRWEPRRELGGGQAPTTAAVCDAAAPHPNPGLRVKAPLCAEVRSGVTGAIRTPRQRWPFKEKPGTSAHGQVSSRAARGSKGTAQARGRGASDAHTPGRIWKRGGRRKQPQQERPSQSPVGPRGPKGHQR